MLKTKKYNKLAFMLLFAAIITVSSVFSSTTNVYANNLVSTINFDTDYADATYTNIPGTLIYYEDGVSGDIQYKCAVGWTLLPESMQNKLIEYGATFYISSSVDLTAINEKAVGYANNYMQITKNSEGKITGYYTDPSIFLKVQTVNEDYTGTLLHEAAHVLESTIAYISEGNYNNGQSSTISNSSEWQALYAKYASKIATIDTIASYNVYSAKEAFCDSFRLAYEKPDELKAVAPEVYEFIIETVEKYCG